MRFALGATAQPRSDGADGPPVCKRRLAEGLTGSVAKDLLKSSYTQLWTSRRRASHTFMR